MASFKIKEKSVLNWQWASFKIKEKSVLNWQWEAAQRQSPEGTRQYVSFSIRHRHTSSIDFN